MEVQRETFVRLLPLVPHNFEPYDRVVSRERLWELELEFLVGFARSPFSMGQPGVGYDVDRWPRFHQCPHQECRIREEQHARIAKLNEWVRFLLEACTPLPAGPRRVVFQYSALFHFWQHDEAFGHFFTPTRPFPCMSHSSVTGVNQHPVCAAIAKECATTF